MAMKFEKKSEGVYLLDCQGYVCPHPQMYTKKALEKLRAGEILEVVFDNPSSSESIASMIDSGGHELVEQQKVNGKFSWKIKKVA